LAQRDKQRAEAEGQTEAEMTSGHAWDKHALRVTGERRKLSSEKLLDQLMGSGGAGRAWRGLYK